MLMSSIRSENFRKRKLEFDLTDDDDDIENDRPLSPLRVVKRRRGSNLPSSFISNWRRLVSWLSGFSNFGNFKEYFNATARMESCMPETIVEVDDFEEDEDDVSFLGERKRNHNSPALNASRNPLHDRFRNFSNFVTLPNAKPSIKSNERNEYHGKRLGQGKYFEPSNHGTSTPANSSFKKSGFNEFMLNPPKPLSRSCDNLSRYKEINGFANSSLRNGQVSSFQKRYNGFKEPDIETDIEILLDDDKKQQDEDEIEVLAEVHSPSKSSFKSSTDRQYYTLNRNGIHSQDKKSFEESHSGATNVAQNRRRLYTAQEVVRLQEKRSYQLLIDKYVKGSVQYQPIRKPVSQNAAVQVDLTDEPLVINHFKKEVIDQPVEYYLQKYYTPCRLVSSKLSKREEPPKQPAKQPEEEVIEDKDDDSDIEILEVKLPKYKCGYKTVPHFFSPEWIQELKMTVCSQSEERMRLIKEYEQQLQNVQKEKEELLVKEMQERDLIGLEEGVIDESKIDEEEEFIELTPEMEAEIDAALNPNLPRDDLICSIGESRVIRKDLDSLCGLSWLNDAVINCYLDLIVERSKEENYPSVYYFNTYFYSALKKGNPKIKRWTKRVDIFSYDINLVPLHLDVHWCITVINHKNKTIRYYDSMGSGEEQSTQILRDYLITEMQDKKNIVMDPNTYTLETVKDIPQQMNGCDCGMFTLKYAEYITRNAEITFSQKHMPYFRRRTIYELLHKKLL